MRARHVQQFAQFDQEGLLGGKLGGFHALPFGDEAFGVRHAVYAKAAELGTLPQLSDLGNARMRWFRYWRRWLAAFLLVWLASALWQANKPLPEGVSIAAPLQQAQRVRFLADVTFVDANGVRHSEQAIFDEALAMIARARRLIVLDMFLFNAHAGASGAPLRPLSSELTQALLNRIAAVPGIAVIVITDPVNTVYGGQRAPHLDALRQAGAHVVTTNLSQLRASNPAWSGLWNLCCRIFGNNLDGGWLPNPLGAGKVTLRSWLALPNFSANHRKTLVVDEGDGYAALVMSANPHDASSAHGNVALRFSGAAALDVLASERAVAGFSGGSPVAFDPFLAPSQTVAETQTEPLRVQVLTESRIRDALIAALDTAQPGEHIDIAVFYLAHRSLVESLISAKARGVNLRVLLDPNRDAFGRTKNGVPNRQVARELHEAGIDVRWCDTHGEQCHAKLLHKRAQDGSAELIAGSANFTRRNLDDYNLETSVRLLAPADAAPIAQAAAWFDAQWNNLPDRSFSLPYEAYADDALLRRIQYRIGEAAGLSTW